VPGGTRTPGAGWRSALAIALIALVAVGSVAFTDDAWPFAPFRMFSVAVRPNGSVVKVDFLGTTASGRTRPMDAADFGLRRAEVEGQQGDGGRLSDRQLAALAAGYNRDHPADPLVELQFRRLGRRLIDGEPGESFVKVLQTWHAEDRG
jgi:hypothetical protein